VVIFVIKCIDFIYACIYSGGRSKRTATPVTPYNIEGDLLSASSSGTKPKHKGRQHKKRKSKCAAVDSDGSIDDESVVEVMERHPRKNSRLVVAAPPPPPTAQPLPVVANADNQRNEIESLKRQLSELTEMMMQRDAAARASTAVASSTAQETDLALIPQEQRRSDVASAPDEQNHSIGYSNQCFPRVQMNQSIFSNQDVSIRQVLEHSLMSSIEIACERDMARHEALRNYNAMKRAECQQQQQAIRAALSIIGSTFSK
jgi:phage-related minor tail protein